MRYLLIPIKDLTHAKQRLAPVLSPPERVRLATWLMERTLRVAAESRLTDRRAIVSNYGPAIELAGRLGIEVIQEVAQSSESHSVDFGSAEVMKRGARAVLRIPIDLPLLTAEDIDAVIAVDQGERGVVIVPSRDGTGTNAILRRPPDSFPSRFGPHSFDQHLAAAREAGLPCHILQNPNIAFDVDDPEDLQELLKLGLEISW
jgi:2-phospho-L-lactate guanylyltransferase